MTWNLEMFLARAYLRGLVALRNLNPLIQADPAGATLGTFQPTSFISGGYSKRGIAQWFVATGDPMVKFIFVGAGEQPNLPTYTQLKFAQWGDQSSIIKPLSYYDTDFGKSYIAQADPFAWPSHLGNVKISMFRGSNDEIWPFGLIDTYLPVLPIDHVGFIGGASHMYGGDSGFTLADTDLLAAWYGAVGRLNGNAPAPTITATYDLTANPVKVSATVTGASPTAQVHVWWTTSINCVKPPDSQYAHYIVWGKDDVDMRDVVWQSQTIGGSSGSYSGTLPTGVDVLPLHSQIFMDIEDTNRFASTLPVAVTGGTDKSCP
jgi:hypothetical protein